MPREIKDIKMAEAQLKHHQFHHHTTTVSGGAPPRRSARVRAVMGGGRAAELIKSGAVSAIAPKEAASAMASEGYRLLDVRPEWEWEKARVSGSLHVPLFVEDKDKGAITLLKKWVHFGYIGLWTGQQFTMMNPAFVDEVARMAPDKDSKLLLACGEGLRSLVGVAKLYEVGYRKLGWLAGGFGRASDGDFGGAVEGTEKLQYATVGGASYYMLKLLLLLRVVGDKS
ncbi:rhodanese-like domain-containing protein 10 [Andrographis paniculata]|uniref:rhodanese-like domain-containing protein 10 n=1 Tax=Andrographis paniculata TaxID=175694 RepID=UPI0021E732D7|nr:rhodanese-like domain-containing protein 10 [Andrographis paniculata]